MVDGSQIAKGLFWAGLVWFIFSATVLNSAGIMLGPVLAIPHLWVQFKKGKDDSSEAQSQSA